MRINPMNTMSFQAKITPNKQPMNLPTAEEIGESIGVGSLAGSLASTAGLGTVGSTVLTASGLAASGSDIAGTAFIADASDVNSSGIVPSVLEEAQSVFTPGSIDWAAQHPSLVGLGLSTAGNMLGGTGASSTASKTKAKDPS